MSQNILNVSSNQPFVPIENVRAVDVQPPVANMSDESLPEIVAKYKQIFCDKSCVYSYPGLEDCILVQLGSAIDKHTKYANDFAKLSEIYSDIRQINDTFIDDICREGYVALQFYAKSIVGHVQALHASIEEAQAALKSLEAVVNATEGSEYEKMQKARPYIDKLIVNEDFARNETNALMQFYQYNNDTKQWDVIKFTDDNKFDMRLLFLNDPIKNYEDYKQGDGKVKGLEYLRQTPIKYKDSRDDKENAGPIQVFNSLNMVARLKYLWMYYKLIIEGGDTNYTVFPGGETGAETGFPCLPDVPSKKDTEATKNLGALELFYVGYLIDRDGPINAVSSFFEVKVQALRENLSIQSKSISALNTYMEFINRGLNVLNSSQSGANDGNKHRIPDGAAVALLYLCGGNMYNLFETEDGTKCLVIENDKEAGTYMLVSADEAGMNLLIGDTGNAKEDGYRGNCGTTLTAKNGIMYCDEFYSYQYASDSGDENKKVNLFSKTPSVYYTSEGIKALIRSPYNGYAAKSKSSGNKTFVPPIRIDCAKVLPNSVRQWPGGDKLNFDSLDNIKTEVVSSWTDAFNSKTKFINTAIDTINTDIQVDRSKIDSFDSICSTFRSRAHEAHANTAANVR